MVYGAKTMIFLSVNIESCVLYVMEYFFTIFFFNVKDYHQLITRSIFSYIVDIIFYKIHRAWRVMSSDASLVFLDLSESILLTKDRHSFLFDPTHNLHVVSV